MLDCKNKYFLLIFILLFVGISLMGVAQAETAKVAIIGFEADDMSWTDDEEFARKTLEGIARQYTEKLANEEVVEVVDRSRVEEVLNQLNYKTGDSLDLSLAAQMSRMVDTNLLILGRLKKLKVKESGELSIGDFSLSGVDVNVELTARLVDTISGEVLANYEGIGEASDTGFEISNLKGVSFGSEAFADSAAGKAIEKALNKITKDTVDKKEKFAEGTKIPEDKELTAKVVAKVGESLVINKGSKDGIKEEQEGSLKRKIEIEGKEEPMEISLGEIVVSSVDKDTSLVSVKEAKESPKTGDIVNIKLSGGMGNEGDFADRDSDNKISTTVIKKVETPDFIIHIDRVTRSEDEVTFHGTAEAKGKDTELTLLFPDNYSFYDHKGQRTNVYHRYVTIGNKNDGGNVNCYLKELILSGYPTKISWKFDHVPEEADHLARVKLYLETPAAGEVEINLDGVSLMKKY